MIELVLTLVYVGLSGLILWRWWRGRYEKGLPGGPNVACDENPSRDVRIGRLRCMLRGFVELSKSRRERGRR